MTSLKLLFIDPKFKMEHDYEMNAKQNDNVTSLRSR